MATSVLFTDWLDDVAPPLSRHLLDTISLAKAAGQWRGWRLHVNMDLLALRAYRDRIRLMG